MAQPAASPNDPVKWIAAGLALVMLVMGGIFAAVGRHMARRAEASLSWPSTEGVVTSSGEWTDQSEGVSHPTQRGSSTFHYTVNGRTWEFRESGYLGQAAPLPPNATVQVFYDPENPSDHAFASERGQRDRIFGIVSALCVLLSLPFWYLALRLHRRQRLAQRAG